MRDAAWLFLLRHAQTASDGVKRFLGQTDLPLSENGRRQAAGCRDRLQPVDFSKIVSSDLARARETAEIIAEKATCRAGRQRARVEPMPGLREIHLGAWENRPFSEIREAFPDQWRARGNDMARFRPPGGESFADLQRRIVPVVNDIMAAANGNVLAVAHAGVNRVVLCSLLGIPLDRMFGLGQDLLGLNLIDFQRTRPRVGAINLAPDVLARVGWGGAHRSDAPYQNPIHQ